MAAIFYRCSGCDTKQISCEPYNFLGVSNRGGFRSRPAESQRKSSVLNLKFVKEQSETIFCS